MATQKASEKREGYISWEEFHMGIALLAAKRSKDPSAQVGACVVNSAKKIVGIGYNGMPTGCDDDKMPWGKNNPDALDNKYYYVCHAELNSIIYRSSENMDGCTIYVTRFPCNECAKIIIQSGIKKVVYLDDYDRKEYEASKRMFKEVGIETRQYERKQRDINLVV